MYTDPRTLQNNISNKSEPASLCPSSCPSYARVCPGVFSSLCPNSIPSFYLRSCPSSCPSLFPSLCPSLSPSLFPSSSPIICPSIHAPSLSRIEYRYILFHSTAVHMRWISVFGDSILVNNRERGRRDRQGYDDIDATQCGNER